MCLRTVLRVGAMVVAACAALPGCQGTPRGQGVVSHTVSGFVYYTGTDNECDGDTRPAQVRVSVEVYNANNTSGKSAAIAAPGRFDIDVPWATGSGRPDGWRISTVTRIDGSPICEHQANRCPGDTRCIDTGKHPARADLPDSISWQIRCECVASGN